MQDNTGEYRSIPEYTGAYRSMQSHAVMLCHVESLPESRGQTCSTRHLLRAEGRPASRDTSREPRADLLRATPPESRGQTCSARLCRFWHHTAGVERSASHCNREAGRA